MATTRRNFLQRGSVFILGAGIASIVGGAATAGARSLLSGPRNGYNFPDRLSIDSFTPFVNTTFRIQSGRMAIPVTLVEVTDFKAGSENPERIAGRESFSLLFIGTGAGKSSRLKSNIYTIRHATLGEFVLFLEPVGRMKHGQQYEAIISRN